VLRSACSGIRDHQNPGPHDTNLGGDVVNLDKRQLEGAPAYDVGTEPTWGDRSYESKIHDYYGVGRYWTM
jgi:hypothetical protein